MEALLVTAPAGLAGLALAHMTLPTLVGLLPLELPIPIPGLADISIGWHSIIPAIALAGFSALLTGIAAVLHLTGRRSDEALTNRGTTKHQTRFYDTVILAPTALAVILLAAAAVTARSLWRPYSVDQGFRKDGIVVFRTPLGPRYTRPDDWVRAQQRFADAVSVLPSVQSVAIGSGMPLGGAAPQIAFFTNRVTPEAPLRAGMNEVGPDYFRTLAIPLRYGREFRPSDSAESPPVAIVSESVARRYEGNPVSSSALRTTRRR